MNTIRQQIIIKIQCVDQKGIISAVSSFFYKEGFNIQACQQFIDTQLGRYYMRVVLDAHDLTITLDELENRFQTIAQQFSFEYTIDDLRKAQKVAVLVSKTSHCLYDLLEKYREGILGCEIPVVISNHEDLEPIAKQFGVPFYYLPITPDTKVEQEAAIEKILKENEISLVVMARYMQILSEQFVSNHTHAIINIHHAFLPAFKGANPYRRAYERGVKMIGATAHYATTDLDEGPIIEQDVARVSHVCSPKKLSQIGADIERKVLSIAVKSHIEGRIIVHQNRTIVFPEIND